MSSAANNSQRTSHEPPVRFGVIGLNHNHIYGMTSQLREAGGELVSFFAQEPELTAEFGRRFPEARLARSKAEVLEDTSIALVASAAIPNERAPLGVEVMRHGKDYLSDKAAFTSLDQLEEARRVTRETGRIYSVSYSERFQNRATVRAGELVQEGAIGRVLQTVGLGPHRLNAATRPDWFFRRAQYGGILTDIGSHQADQFLFFTGSTSAEVVASQIANFAHPEYPELDDFGDMLLRGDGGSGYVRVDWFTPDGLSAWGDGRLTILGTEGFIELRKNLDIAGREGGDHLFLVDQRGTRYIDCQNVELPFGRQLLEDVRNRTETAMTQAHAFLASELALKAQAQARLAMLQGVAA
jgi:predicted dehydrogenase